MAITDSTYDYYIGICLDHPKIRGRETIIELVAIGAAESGLDNLAIGRNDLNGTPMSSKAYYSLGLGWLQHDSYWLQQDWLVNGVDWSIEEIRSNPVYSLDLLDRRPGMILYQGVDRTYINTDLWATWPRKSDPFMADAAAAYKRVTS